MTNNPGKAHGEFPTASGGIARLAYDTARRRGVQLAPLMAGARLTEIQIRDADSRIRMASQIALLDAIAKALADEWFGFHLAQKTDLRELGMLYYVTASSETLADALQRLARYSSIANEGLLLKCVTRGSVRVEFEYVGIARHTDRHQMEFLMSFLLRLCRHLTGKPLLPTRVSFSHSSTFKDPVGMSAFFGPGLQFGERTDELRFEEKCLTLALERTDPYLNRLLVRECERVLALRRPRSGPFRAQVENAIAPLLPHGKARISQIAAKLGLSRRTTTRRLAAEGVTFSDVLLRVRKDLAARYLRDPALTISQTAWLLGYQEVSAFSHAYKRWAGHTPAYERSQYLR